MNPKLFKNLLILAVVILSIAMAYQFYFYKKLSKEIKSQNATELMHLQEKCSLQSSKIANSENHRVLPSKDFHSYHSHSSHYNYKLKKCFALIHTETSNSQGYLSYGERLIDAFENRDYGSYTWTKSAAKGEQYFGNNPLFCRVMPTLNEEKQCTSLKEFKLFVSHYLE
jgi:hypothetical protein